MKVKADIAVLKKIRKLIGDTGMPSVKLVADAMRLYAESGFPKGEYGPEFEAIYGEITGFFISIYENSKMEEAWDDGTRLLSHLRRMIFIVTGEGPGEPTTFSQNYAIGKLVEPAWLKKAKSPKSKLKLSFEIFALGWATISLALDKKEKKTAATWRSDVLGDFAKGVLKISEKKKASFAYVGEPELYAWDLRRVGKKVTISIKMREDADSARGKEEELLSLSVELNDFLRATVAMLLGTYKAYGLKGFRKKWDRYDFPVEELRKLMEKIK